MMRNRFRGLRSWVPQLFNSSCAEHRGLADVGAFLPVIHLPVRMSMWAGHYHTCSLWSGDPALLRKVFKLDAFQYQVDASQYPNKLHGSTRGSYSITLYNPNLEGTLPLTRVATPAPAAQSPRKSAHQGAGDRPVCWRACSPNAFPSHSSSNTML